MSSYLEKLRKKSSENFQKLKDDVDKLSASKQGDERVWNITVDKTGNGFAVLRFLPPMEGEQVAFVKRYNHFFQGENGKYYGENCPSTLGKSCPVCDMNREIWNTHNEEDARVLIGKKKRQLEYYSNVYVVQDKENPENEGKVFLFRYGTKIFEKIKNAIKPEFDDEMSFDPFSIDEGALFYLKAKTKDKFRNYDASYFGKPSLFLDGDDEKIEEVLKNIYSLESIVDPKLFKEFPELELQLKRVSDKKSAGSVRRNIEEQIENETPMDKTQDVPWKEDAETSDVSIDDILAGLE